MTQQTQDYANGLVQQYLGTPIAQPQPDTQIGDIASGVQKGYQDNGIVGASGQGITELAKYANTPQGMKLMGLIAQQQGGNQGRDVAEAYYGGAEQLREREMAANQYANEQEKEKAAVAAPIVKTEQEGVNTLANTIQQGTQGLAEANVTGQYGLQGKMFEAQTAASNLKNQQAFEAHWKDINNKIDAGKFDETQKADFESKIQGKVDPETFAALHKMTPTELSYVKYQQPNLWDQLHSVISTGHLAKTTMDTKGTLSNLNAAGLLNKNQVANQ